MAGIVQRAVVIQPGMVELGSVRVRAYSSDVLVADADPPMLVWEHGFYPQYFFAPGEVKVELRAAGPGPRSRGLGPSKLYDAVVGDEMLAGAAQQYPDAPVPGLRDMMTMAWSAFDTWLAVAGLVCFWPEKCSGLEVYVDGERIGRP